MEISYAIGKLGQKLENFVSLSFEEFVAEVRHRFPKNGRKGSDPLGVAGFIQQLDAPSL